MSSRRFCFAALVASSCDKVPLLAPTGTVITLFPGASTVPVDGNVEIIATVIENGVADGVERVGHERHRDDRHRYDGHDRDDDNHDRGRRQQDTN